MLCFAGRRALVLQGELHARALEFQLHVGDQHRLLAQWKLPCFAGVGGIEIGVLHEGIALEIGQDLL